MDKNSRFFAQVELLMRVLPHLAKHDCFALKGGTAINLFVRDLPRLSVDIDLARPHGAREAQGGIGEFASCTLDAEHKLKSHPT
jgi:predicted nucleotidyltransferase component of viral defense system